MIEPSLLFLVADARRQWGKESEISVHGLKVFGIASGDMSDQTAMSGGGNRCHKRLTGKASGRIDARQTAHRRRFSIAFHADQLASQKYRASVLQL